MLQFSCAVNDGDSKAEIKTNKKDCSNLTKFSVSLFTNINLDSNKSLTIKTFNKGSHFQTLKECQTMDIISKQYDCELHRRCFDKIGIVNGYSFHQISYCDLVNYNLDWVDYPNKGNISFFK